MIFGAAVVAYVPAMSAGLIWDDEPLIFANPFILAEDGLHDIWFTTKTKDYFPLTWSLFWVQWRIWGIFCERSLV